MAMGMIIYLMFTILVACIAGDYVGRRLGRRFWFRHLAELDEVDLSARRALDGADGGEDDGGET